MNKQGLEGITAAQSSISSIVDATLTYRGYTIEDLAEHAVFEEIIFLLWYGRLPKQFELESLKEKLFTYGAIPEKVLHLLRELPKEGDSMEMLRTLVSSLSLYNQQEADVHEEAMKIQAQMSSLVAAIYRHKKGKVPLRPLNKLSFAENFLYMASGSEPNPIESEALNKALILHADHELNASTFSARVTVATLSDIYSGMTSAIGTLKGPLHGGANEQVLKMLKEIDSMDNVKAFVQQKIDNKEKIMGIGHRVYKNGDPRAFILKEMAKKMTVLTGEPKWFDMLTEIEKMVFEQKGLKPNVDFYSAFLYHSLGFSEELFTPIFAVSRTSGWIAHILEQYENNRLIRPRAEYIGLTNQHYISVSERN